MKPVRFLPLVALAAFSLLALKLAGMMMGEGYMLTGSAPSVAKTNPDGGQGDAPKSKEGQKKTAKKSSADGKPKRVKKSKIPNDVTSIPREDTRPSAEIALLTSLAKRRKQLDRRERNLSFRVNLIKAAEQRINERIAVLKDLELKVQRFAKAQKQAKKTQFARLVKMYSSMKPKGAALIFNELDEKVLLGIIQNMKPTAMSSILAAMDPAKARELTISMAGNTQQKFTEKSLDELPKINGK